MKMYLISDNVDTYTGMRLAGVDGIVIHEREELRTALEDVLADKTVGIVLLTEKLGREFPDLIDTFRLEEKITHLKTTSMEQARAEGNAIIDSHREALDKVFEDHKAEALRQSETRIKAETTNAKLALNQALAKSQLEIKRKQSKIQQELKDKIFEEAQDLIHAFMKTEAYDDFLIRCIRSAVRFAGTDPVTVYINLSDEKKKTALEDATQVHLSVSAEDFIGGVRSVIRSRNILIDNSFQTQLKDQYDKFIFEGGDGIG